MQERQLQHNYICIYYWISRRQTVLMLHICNCRVVCVSTCKHGLCVYLANAENYSFLSSENCLLVTECGIQLKMYAMFCSRLLQQIFT